MYQVVVYNLQDANSKVSNVFDSYKEANEYADLWCDSQDEVAVVFKV